MQIADTVEEVNNHCIGFCKEFMVEAAMASAQASQPAGEMSPEPRPEQSGHSGECVPGEAAPVRRGGGPTGTRTLMVFSGCPRALGATIVLRGASAEELAKVSM